MGADFRLEGDIDFNTAKGWAQIDALMAHVKEVMGRLPSGQNTKVDAATFGHVLDRVAAERKILEAQGKPPSIIDPTTLLMFAAYLKSIDQTTAAYQRLRAEAERTHEVISKPITIKAVGANPKIAQQVLEGAQPSSSDVFIPPTPDELQRQEEFQALRHQPPQTSEAAQHAHQRHSSVARYGSTPEWSYDVGWNAAGYFNPTESDAAKKARLDEIESRITFSKQTAIAGATTPPKVVVSVDADTKPAEATVGKFKEDVKKGVPAQVEVHVSSPAIQALDEKIQAAKDKLLFTQEGRHGKSSSVQERKVNEARDALETLEYQKELLERKEAAIPAPKGKSFKGVTFGAPKSKAGWTRLENKFAEYGAGKLALGPDDELYQRLIQSGIAVEAKGGGLVANKNFKRPEGMETKARVKVEVDDAEAKTKKAKIVEPAVAHIRFDVEAAREKQKDIVSELANTPAGPERQALLLEQAMLKKKIDAWETAQADKVAARATAAEQGKGKARTEDEQEAVNAEAEHAQALISEAKAASEATKATASVGAELDKLIAAIKSWGGYRFSGTTRLQAQEHLENAMAYVQGKPLNLTNYTTEAAAIANLKAAGMIAQSGRAFGPAFDKYVGAKFRGEPSADALRLHVRKVGEPNEEGWYSQGGWGWESRAAAARGLPVEGQPPTADQIQAVLGGAKPPTVLKGAFIPGQVSREVKDSVDAWLVRVVNSYGAAGTGRPSQPDLILGQRAGLINAAGMPTPLMTGIKGPRVERAADVRPLTDSQGAVDTRVTEEYITHQRNLSMSLTRMGRIALTTGIAMVGMAASVVKASDSLDLAYGKLGQAMKSTGEYSKQNVASFKAQAIELLKLSGDSVAATLDDMSYAKSLKLTNEQIKELTPRVADISAAIGVDMQTAYKASSLALNGITTQMRRLGFYVTEGSDALVGLDDIMKATSGVMGAAEARGKTLTGSLGKLKGQAALTGAAFGETLAPALTNVLGKVTGMLEQWEKLPEGAKKAIGSFVGLTGVAIMLAGALAIVAGAIAAVNSGLARIGIKAGLGGLFKAAGVLAKYTLGTPLGATVAAVAATAYVANKVPQDIPNVYDYRYGKGIIGSSSDTESRYVPTSRVQGGRGSGAYNRGAFSQYNQNTGAPSGYWRDLDKASERPALSEEAQTALDSLTDKLYELHHGGLMASQRLLEIECKAMIAMGGEVAASAKEYQKERSAELTKEAQANINERYWGIGKTDEQKQLHALELELADQLKNNAPGYPGTPEYEEWKAKIAAVGAAEAKEIKEGSKKGWEPINIEGTNVNQLLPFIASLQGGKPKKQVLEVDVKLDGKTIKIDTSSAFSRENIDKIGRAVIQQMLANKSWSFATTGG